MEMQFILRTMVLVAVVVGCTEAPDESGCLSLEVLKEIEYRVEHGRGERMVKLANGRYDSRDLRLTATLMDSIEYGDLDGDGSVEAIVVLVTNTGGSGAFRYLTAVACRNGSAVHVASAFMGDRIRLKGLSMRRDTVVVEMIAHGRNEPFCCPTEHVTRTYRLDGGGLSEVETRAGNIPE